ncbi:hypothetical protein CAPTEDRAFT_199249 [Capitella teleta]|uniref:G-protein coupled receptors family 1 profile domain-containing protein n=1 Tax=Capitella teleta TaxID=283909 RepID=R7UCT6_CAPTE|nr:hypothetical protein CAPTEDRAFT_199249 [Capitella teleta]|eukprot:ELU03804.1 hypothetical protein CAPTEDRAFT_199249 [Capitella teleta]
MANFVDSNDNSTIYMVTEDTDEDAEHSYSETFKAVSISILLLLTVFIIGVNSLVILAFAGNHIPRTKSNFYMLLLAIADVCVGFVLPINVISIAVDSLANNTTFCMFETAVTIGVLSSSTCCILALTIDRLEALRKALEYSSDMSLRMYFERSAFVLFFPCVLCLILPFAWHNDLQDTPVKACYTLYILKRKFCSYVFLPMIFIIFTAVALTYIPILKIALRHSRSIHSMDAEVNADTANRNRHMKHQLRILKTATMVLLPFFGGWMPWIFTAASVIYNPDEYANPGMPFNISQFISYPGVLNSGINPFIYAARLPEYRQAFKKLLGCKPPQPTGPTNCPNN